MDQRNLTQPLIYLVVKSTTFFEDSKFSIYQMHQGAQNRLTAVLTTKSSKVSEMVYKIVSNDKMFLKEWGVSL